MDQDTSWRFPKLTEDLDCGPRGYPGLAIRFWLNLTYDPDRESDEAYQERSEALQKETGKGLPDREIWASDYWYYLGRIVEAVVVPAQYTPDGEKDVTIPIPDGRALRELLFTRGFPQSAVLWACQQYYELKEERLEAQAKN